MDPTVSAALLGGITTLAETAQDQLIAILPVALPVLAGVAGMYFAIRTVRSVVHI